MCDFNAMEQCHVNERANGLGYYTFGSKISNTKGTNNQK